MFRGKMEAEVSEGDHRFYVWRVEGRAVLKTQLSTPFKDISAKLVSIIARQLQLPDGGSQLAQLVNCTITREQWRAHVASLADGGARRRY